MSQFDQSETDPETPYSSNHVLASPPTQSCARAQPTPNAAQGNSCNRVRGNSLQVCTPAMCLPQVTTLVTPQSVMGLSDLSFLSQDDQL